MSAADRIRHALAAVEPGGEDLYREDDVADLLAERDALLVARDQLAVAHDRAVDDLEEARRDRDNVAAGGRDLLAERDRLKYRIARARAILDEWDQPDGVGSLIDRTIAALDGEIR